MFTNAYAGEIQKPEQVCTSTERLCLILYAQEKNSYLNKIMKNKCQHLTETQLNELLKLLQNLNNFLMEHLTPRKQIH